MRRKRKQGRTARGGIRTPVINIFIFFGLLHEKLSGLVRKHHPSVKKMVSLMEERFSKLEERTHLENI